MDPGQSPSEQAGSRLGRIGFLAGPILAGVALALPPPAGLAPEGWRVAALAIWMAVWWLTEAIPLAATALLPLVLLPALGVRGIEETAAPYANPVIFLFLGGFLIAAALARCGLHRRFALGVVRAVGPRPRRLVGGFMAATAALSMWVSNTATAVIMLPLSLSVLPEEEVARRRLAPALLLGVAYAANLGGLGTLIGTPPNAFLAGFLSEAYGIEIGFLPWMLVGVPLVLVSVPITWWLLVHRLHPLAAGEQPIEVEIPEASGPLRRAEWIVGGITGAVCVAWVTRPVLEAGIPGLSDAGIAMAGALLLFAVPVGLRPLRFPLTWTEAERLPWGVLVLFGGGLSLASAIQDTGLAPWIGARLELFGRFPLPVLILAVTLVMVFLTELTSNTATAAAFLPVVAALAVGVGASPLALAVPAALAASCAFMLPVATPPNAVVYGSGEIELAQMARAGLWLNLLMTGLILVVALWLVPGL